MAQVRNPRKFCNRVHPYVPQGIACITPPSDGNTLAKKVLALLYRELRRSGVQPYLAREDKECHHAARVRWSGYNNSFYFLHRIKLDRTSCLLSAAAACYDPNNWANSFCSNYFVT